MPSKSKKQHRFMGAVANNPEFAAEVGVPQSVGAEFMAKGKKKYMGGGLHRMPRYQIGGPARVPERDRTAATLGQGIGSMGAVEGIPTIQASEGPFRRPPTPRELRMDETRNRPMGFTVEDVTKAKKKRKNKKKQGKGLRNLYVGGKIRGCGKAIRGRKKAKMVRMKGS